MEEKIDQQSDLYKTLLEAQSDLGEGLLILEDGRILRANEAFCKISGYDKEELSCLPSCFDLLVEEERRLFDERLRWRIDDELVVEHYATTILTKGGQRIEVECAAKTLRTEGSTRLIVLVRDITWRKRDEEKLQQNLEALVALYEAGQVFASSLKLEEVGPTVLEVVQRISEPAAGVICLPSKKQEPFEVRDAIGPENLWRWARSTPEAKEARERVLAAKEHRLVHLPLVGGQSERSVPYSPFVGLYFPLLAKGELVGLLEMYRPEALEERDTLLNGRLPVGQNDRGRRRSTRIRRR